MKSEGGGGYVPISLSHFQVVYILCAGVILLAIVAFLVEMSTKLKEKLKRKRVTLKLARVTHEIQHVIALEDYDDQAY